MASKFLLLFNLKNVTIYSEGEKMALFITLIVGLFTFLGSLIIFFVKNNKKIVDFSISIGFGALIALIILELIPETLELIQTKFMVMGSIVVTLLLLFVGIGILKILDKFIPHHEGKSKDTLVHIGIMTSIALVVHNLLEGMAIYTSFNSSMTFGSMLGFGVALHNIPLGMSITSMFYKNSKDNVKAVVISLLVSLSTFLGGLIAIVFSEIILVEFYRGAILSITLGMLIYIVLFELLPHILENKNKKNICLGIILGIVLITLSSMLS